MLEYNPGVSLLAKQFETWFTLPKFECLQMFDLFSGVVSGGMSQQDSCLGHVLMQFSSASPHHMIELCEERNLPSNIWERLEMLELATTSIFFCQHRICCASMFVLGECIAL